MKLRSLDTGSTHDRRAIDVADSEASEPVQGSASQLEQPSDFPAHLQLTPIARAMGIIPPHVRAQAVLIGKNTVAATSAVVLGATAFMGPCGEAAADASIMGAHVGSARTQTLSPDQAAEAQGTLRFPIGGGRYNIGYDSRWSVFDQSSRPLHNSDFSRTRTDARHTRGHPGIDIFGPLGAPVVAPISGTVVAVGTSRKGGHFVSLRSGNQQFYFAHLQAHAPDLAVGARVSAGDALGTLGNTGSARGTAPHVHLELKVDGVKVNPFDLLMRAHRAELSRG